MPCFHAPKRWRLLLAAGLLSLLPLRHAPCRAQLIKITVNGQPINRPIFPRQAQRQPQQVPSQPAGDARSTELNQAEQDRQHGLALNARGEHAGAVPYLLRAVAVAEQWLGRDYQAAYEMSGIPG